MCRRRPWRATTCSNSAVYSTYSSGPSTDPCGTPNSTLCGDDRRLWYETCCVRPDTNERIQSRAVSVRPNTTSSRCSRMSWSTQSNAADRSSRPSSGLLGLGTRDSSFLMPKISAKFQRSHPISMSVCLLICLSVLWHTAKFTVQISPKILYLWPGPPQTAMQCVICISGWCMRLCFHMMERMGQNQRRRVCFAEFTTWHHRGRSY